MRKLSMALVLVTLVTAGTLTAHAQSFTVRGMIQEYGSTIGMQPLAGATIALSGGRSTISVANGFYSLSSVPVGTYAVRISAPNHRTIDTQITVNTNLVVSYVLHRTTDAPTNPPADTRHDLRGTVTESGTFGTRVLAGAKVVVTPGSHTARTDAAGRYFFDELPAGTYTVTASAAGHRTVSRSIPLRSDAEVGIDLPVLTTSDGHVDDDDDDDDGDSRGRVSGVIRTSDGHALSGASIRLTPGNYTATTDSEGRFTLASVPNGTYMMHIRASGYPAMNRKVTIGSDRTMTLTMSGKGRSSVDRDDGDDDDGKGTVKETKQKKEKKEKKGRKSKGAKGKKSK